MLYTSIGSHNHLQALCQVRAEYHCSNDLRSHTFVSELMVNTTADFYMRLHKHTWHVVALAYILHELWLLGVFRVYTTLNFSLRTFAAHKRGIHHVTMIYILHLQSIYLYKDSQVLIGNHMYGPGLFH